LSDLSSEEKYLPSTSLKIEPISQMDLFLEKEKLVRNELKSVNINNLTPLEALAKLDELQKSVNEE